MPTEIITKEDLEEFRIKILAELKEAILESKNRELKKWLKGTEVCELLKIGTSKLQNLRITGKLSSSKIGGVHYYQLEEIEKMLNNPTL
jgi:Helix-turn-helix domain